MFYHLLFYYAFFTKDKRLFLAVIYSGKVSEVHLRKKVFPGQNLSTFRISVLIPHKKYPLTLSNFTVSGFKQHLICLQSL